MLLIVNPGAHWNPGERHSPEASAANMAVLVADVLAGGAVVDSWAPIIGDASETESALTMGGTKYHDHHDGRYPFRVSVNGVSHLVEMPGLPIEEVRWIDGDDQNLLDFPRIFIDGSSWIWLIGVSVLVDGDE